MTKPDFSDAGYGQIGCFLMAIGIVVGFAVAFLVTVTGLVPDPNPSGTYDFPVWLAEVALGASTIGVIASSGLMWLVERVRSLWGVADGALLVGSLVIPALAVVLLSLTPTGAALVLPLSLGSLLVWAVGTVWVIVGLALRSGTVTRPIHHPHRAVRQAVSGLRSMTATRQGLASIVVVWLGAGALTVLLPNSSLGRVGQATFGVGLIVAFGALAVASFVPRSQISVAQRLGVGVLCLVMVGLGVVAILLAAGYDNATISARMGPLLVGGMGIALAFIGAYLAFWSQESVLLRACETHHRGRRGLDCLAVDQPSGACRILSRVLVQRDHGGPSWPRCTS